MTLNSYSEAIERNCRKLHNQIDEARALMELHLAVFYRMPSVELKTYKGGLCLVVTINAQDNLDDFLKVMPGPYIRLKDFNPMIFLDEHRITPVQIVCHNEFLSVNTQYIEKIDDKEII